MGVTTGDTRGLDNGPHWAPEEFVLMPVTEGYWAPWVTLKP